MLSGYLSVVTDSDGHAVLKAKLKWTEVDSEEMVMTLYFRELAFRRLMLVTSGPMEH